MYTPERESRGFIGQAVARVSAMARNLLDPRTAKLIEAGLITECLTVTREGVEAIHAIAVSKWGKELEETADAILAERTK